VAQRRQGPTITLFGTGIADLTLPLKVKIGGEDAAVTSVSLVDGQPGWFQVSVTIPDDAAHGCSIERGHVPRRASESGWRNADADLTAVITSDSFGAVLPAA